MEALIHIYRKLEFIKEKTIEYICDVDIVHTLYQIIFLEKNLSFLTLNLTFLGM